MANDEVTIKKAYFEHLKKHEALIHALWDCGVDNWEGYSEAVKIAFPDEEDDKDGD